MRIGLLSLNISKHTFLTQKLFQIRIMFYQVAKRIAAETVILTKTQ